MQTLGYNLANGITISIVSQAIQALYLQVLENSKKGDFKMLEIMHHLTSGVKAYATEMLYFGLDELR